MSDCDPNFDPPEPHYHAVHENSMLAEDIANRKTYRYEYHSAAEGRSMFMDCPAGYVAPTTVSMPLSGAMGTGSEQFVMLGRVVEPEEANTPTETDPKKVGLEARYKVERLTLSRSGKDHTNCEYFVFDLRHDYHGRLIVWKYAATMFTLGYHKLAQDLRSLINNLDYTHPLERPRP